MKQITTQPTFQQDIRRTNQLALYDKYGAMAYGIILQVIPEPELAQILLIDLFSSPQLNSPDKVLSAGDIIRLARAKALSARPLILNSALPPVALPSTNDTMSTVKLVFTLSFCQGYSLEAIAEKLHLSSTNVLKAFYTYFKHLRSS